MSIVYISGPMAGYDGLNEVAFRAAAQTILDRGDAPLVPHNIVHAATRAEADGCRARAAREAS